MDKKCAVKIIYDDGTELDVTNKSFVMLLEYESKKLDDDSIDVQWAISLNVRKGWESTVSRQLGSLSKAVQLFNIPGMDSTKALDKVMKKDNKTTDDYQGEVFKGQEFGKN